MSYNIDDRRLSERDKRALGSNQFRGRPMTKVVVDVTQRPELRYSANALAVCKLYVRGAYYVAFGGMAEQMAKRVMVGDKIRVTGYWKPYTWKDADGNLHTREDFMVKAWEVV